MNYTILIEGSGARGQGLGIRGQVLIHEGHEEHKGLFLATD